MTKFFKGFANWKVVFEWWTFKNKMQDWLNEDIFRISVSNSK